MEQFVYHQSIKTIDLRIATFDDLTIHLTDFTKTKRRNSSKYTYVLDAKNYKLKAAWKKQIEEILWKQMQKIKGNFLLFRCDFKILLFGKISVHPGPWMLQNEPHESQTCHAWTIFCYCQKIRSKHFTTSSFVGVASQLGTLLFCYLFNAKT